MLGEGNNVRNKFRQIHKRPLERNITFLSKMLLKLCTRLSYCREKHTKESQMLLQDKTQKIISVLQGDYTHILLEFRLRI